jgi:hypothetical protein
VKQSQWKELLDMKDSYSKYKEKKEDFIIANKHYNVIPNPDMSVYNYDSGSNQYISKNIEENAEYYNDNPFSDFVMFESSRKYNLNRDLIAEYPKKILHYSIFQQVQ